jgi:sterol desaturase/sphingolipid hydroxylase (fatty acid hydroxylase superfamily)
MADKSTVHHNSVNPSPWSSLSMHPIEHLLYWSDSLIHLIAPSHPLIFLYTYKSPEQAQS